MLVATSLICIKNLKEINAFFIQIYNYHPELFSSPTNPEKNSQDLMKIRPQACNGSSMSIE